MCEDERPTDSNVVDFGDAKRRLESQHGQRERGPETAPRTAADDLVALATASAAYFTDDGEPYAAVLIEGHREVLRLRSPDFRIWLDHAYFKKFGCVPKPGKRRDAIAILEGLARFDGAAQRVHVRVGEHGGAIYLDIGNDRRDVVKIDDEGWRFAEGAPPVRFRRPKGFRPIPRPERGGSIEELRPFLNVDDESFILVVGWLLGTLRPSGPYPILVVQGEQGVGKSTLSRIARRLVDNTKAPLRSMARSERDLAVSAMSSRVIAFDNLSAGRAGRGLSPTVSDALCRVSTGGGVSARKLYTDSDEVIHEFVRPVIVNGIDDLAVRGDLAERALIVTPTALPPARRRDESSFWTAFDAVAARALGALLDAVVAARANYTKVSLPSLPRMADFARWVTAAEVALGWPSGTFVSAYDAHRKRLESDAMDRDPIGRLIPMLPALRQGTEWTGTAVALYQELAALDADSHRRADGWPAAPNALSAHLRRLAPLLRAAGYIVTTRRSASERTIVISREPS